MGDVVGSVIDVLKPVGRATAGVFTLGTSELAIRGAKKVFDQPDVPKPPAVPGPPPSQADPRVEQAGQLERQRRRRGRVTRRTGPQGALVRPQNVQKKQLFGE